MTSVLLGFEISRSDRDELLLDVRDLTTRLSTRRGVIEAVNGVSFRVHAGETVAIVGESGSGKSMTCLSILGLPPQPGGEIVSGEVLLRGADLLKMNEGELRALRGREISMILQDPTTALNPALTVGFQIEETLKTHLSMERVNRRARAVELLRSVDISEPERRMKSYPHELSGGMQQRVAGALAIACDPLILIADEPTTALDTTIQAQYLRLLRRLQLAHQFGLILVTHDFGVIARLADRVLVMYGGRVVEEGPVRDIIRRPRHPYTIGLLSCLPDKYPDRSTPLTTIPGEPPDLIDLPPGCPFAPRCSVAIEPCTKAFPERRRVADNHVSACLRALEPETLDALRAS